MATDPTKRRSAPVINNQSSIINPRAFTLIELLVVIAVIALLMALLVPALRAADPLWPPFKFPLTATERTRLSGKLKLRLEQTRPLLDEISDKVRYGGVDERLKRRTVYEIARVAEHLMVEAAFLRRPGYPGVSTQYRGGHGFTAVIDGPLYEDGDRARERFKAMKYFHLGHRLEEVVRAERDLATPLRQVTEQDITR